MAWFYKLLFNNEKRLLMPIKLKRLSEHKYSCQSSSILDPFLQPWWCFLVSKTPLWLAPNLITIVGLIINILTTLILIYYSPNGREFPPKWACFLCALGLFIYQSLDAIDGKQARRTNSSSPLGELFDHGCDSISTIFVALSACISCQLGAYPNWLFFQCFCAITLFYCAHWQTYVSGTLRFGKVDVTEAQITIMGIHILSAIFGPEIWVTKIFGSIELWWSIPLMTIVCGAWSLMCITSVILAGGVGKNGSTVAISQIGDIELRIVPLYFALAVDTLLAYRYFYTVLVTGGCGKNGSTIAGTSVLSPIIPLCLVVIPAFIIAQKSKDDVFGNYPSLYILAFGMVAAKITNKLVIAHMTKSEMEYLDWCLLGPLLLFLNQYFNSFLPELAILWFTLIWGTQDLIRYCSQICMEICEHLRIKLFKIPYPPKTVPPGGTSQLSSNTLQHDKNGGTHSHRKQNTRSTRKSSTAH